MLLNEFELTIKKSKFIGLLYKIDNEKDIKKILNDIKSIHPKAKHFPYAYILGTTAGKTDDKEPHNSAGMQIYNILNYNNLNSHLLIIIRYFGGTKLGASNLLRTYLEVAKNTVKKITNECDFLISSFFS